MVIGRPKVHFSTPTTSRSTDSVKTGPTNLTTIPKSLTKTRAAAKAFVALAIATLLAIPAGAIATASPTASTATQAAAAPGTITLTDLLVEKKPTPIGIDVDKPRFSWIINSDSRGVVQESYRLTISVGESAPAWDSGIITSDESSNVEYDGPQLESATQYNWSVDVVTNAGSASATSTFRTGLYDAEVDWAGSEWIGNDRVQESGDVTMNLEGASWIHPPYAGGNTPSGYFRKSFTPNPDKTIESAQLVFAGDRGYSVLLNGTQVASGANADDEWKKASRVTVTPAVGANLIAVRLSNTAKAYGGIVGKLTILYTDGTTDDVVTDATWLSNKAANTGWAESSYSTAGWIAAAVRSEYGGSPYGDQVTIPKAPTADTRLTFDTANWISAPTAGNIPSALFRRVLTIPSDKVVSSAQLAVTGDQVFAAYWNGEKVAFNQGLNNEWQTARIVNLNTVPGDNTLALSLATTNGQYGGVIARARIVFTDGTAIDYTTDSRTKALQATEANAPEGWTTAAFDDSAWVAAEPKALYRNWVYGDQVTIPALSSNTSTLTLAKTPWIWTQEASTGTAPGEPRAFRITKATPSGKTATTADILITADDSFALSVNGAAVGQTEGAVNEWQQSHLYEVDLAATSNLFAVKTTNGAGSAAGLIAKIRVHYSDGTADIFTTGTDWKASKTVTPGFEQPGFDDSGWGNAVVQATYGSGPWGSGVRAPVATPNAAPLLRKEFEITGDVETATLYLAAGGYANVSLNGEPISDEVLSPGFTDYDDTVQYVATDLTDQLETGINALGMELGRGFFGMTGSNVWNWQSPPWHDEPMVRAVLKVSYTDGTTQTVKTNGSWTIHDGPTVFDDLYGGEMYDANREQTGFDTVGFNDETWDVASEVNGPTGVLVNQRQQPIRVTEELPATSIVEPVEGTYVVKFPRVLAGWVEIEAEGASGTTIRAQYGEKLRSNGTVNFDNNGGFGSGFQTDRFVLAGTGEPENWEARFSYKGFQYIQVTGWPGDEAPPLSAFTAKAVHTDAPETGTFESANDIMNRTHTAVVDTLKNNIHGIPTDTPMFEKNGWTGDAAVGAEMFLMNLDTHELFAKWMRDVNESRDAEGAPMVIAPSSAGWGEWGINTPWHSAYILIPRWLYQYGNDDRVMTEYYEGMKGYIDLEFNRSTNGLVTNPRLGDWVSPEASPAGGNAPEDTRVSGTAYLYTMLVAMSETAAYLGHDADAEQFAADAAVVKTAFNATFYRADKGYYVGSGDSGYRQTHNVLALAFGMTPNTEAAETTAASIVADIKDKGNHLNTGVLGTKYLLPVLTQYGYEDVAYGLATQTTYPSWGYIVENGGTTMWEHWSLEARSLGHYFLGTVDDWLYHSVAGIQASATTGYRDITIDPAVTEQLAWAKGSTESPFGTVATDWSTSNGRLNLTVDIPVGTRATVRIPAANAWAVSEGGLALEKVDGVTDVATDGSDVLVSIGSGHYEFASDELLGETGAVIDLIDEADATVAQLRTDGELNSTQKSRLTQLLGATRTAALTALDKVRAGDRNQGATALAATLAKLALFDSAVKALDTSDEARAALTADARSIRTAVDAAISTLLNVTGSVALNYAAYKPGEKATATVSVTNGGTVALGKTTARIVDTNWAKFPASATLATKLAATKSAKKAFTVTIPLGTKPGSTDASADIAYVFGGQTIHLPVDFTIVVDSAVVFSSVTVSPTTAAPGDTVNLTAALKNAGKESLSGTVEVDVPNGWVTPLPSAIVTVAAGKTATVKVPVFVPLDADTATRTAELTARFVRDEVVFASKGTDLTVTLAPIVDATGYDHIDLGDSASESAHNLGKSDSSGANTEAGLTRRYAGHLTPYSYFEFDLDVVQGKPFVIRSIETYDRSQTKLYKVYVNGTEVAHRQYPHTTGAGTETWEFVVGAELATSNSVRVKFENQNDRTFYDPSIADVWTQPLAADTAKPELAATLDPATPNRTTGWYQQPTVQVTLNGQDARDGDVQVKYGVDGADLANYTAPITVTAQGTHVVRYEATDAAGNTATGSTTFKVDSIAPIAKAKTKSGKVTFSATDATSGVASTRYRINGGSWKTAKSVTLKKKGRYSIEYVAVDKAGNVSDPLTISVVLKKTRK